MGKPKKMTTQAEWEGAEAARAGRGRSANPYPQSDIAARNQWFAGYDTTVERLSREARKPRFRDF
jgi:ribosome modulation factor